MRVPAGLRFRLSALMFLEYAPFGAWLYYLVVHLKVVLKLPPDAWTWYFMALPVASLAAPWLAGQIADRWFATEKVLGWSHLASSALLALFAFVGHPVALWVLFLCLGVYVPTVGLANSLSFHHLTDPDTQFGSIRVFGSIGWIAALVLDYLLLRFVPGMQVNHVFILAAVLALAAGFFCFTLPHTPPQKGGTERKAAIWQAVKLMQVPSFAIVIIASFVLTVFFQFYYYLQGDFINEARRTLATAEGGWRIHVQGTVPGVEPSTATTDAGTLLTTYAYDVEEKDGTYRIVTRGGATVAVTGLVYTETVVAEGERRSRQREIPREAIRVGEDGFMTIAVPVQVRTLGGLGLEKEYVGLIDGIGTATEWVTLPFLAIIVGVLGVKGAFLLGVGAWVLRYSVFCVGQPLGLVLGSFLFHGICFAFVFIVAQLYVDRVAASDIRASAQSFLNAVMMGFGPLVGAILAPQCVVWFDGNYRLIFLVSLLGSALGGLVVAAGFTERGGAPAPAPGADPEAAAGHS